MSHGHFVWFAHRSSRNWTKAGLLVAATLLLFTWRLAAGQVATDFAFESSAVRVLESAERGEVHVQRLDSGSGPVSFEYEVQPITAVEYIDYIAVPKFGTLTWAAGDHAPKTIPFGIFDNVEADGHKAFRVRRVNLLPPLETTVAILDDEAPIEDFAGHGLKFGTIDSSAIDRKHGLLRLAIEVRNPSTETSSPGFIEVLYNQSHILDGINPLRLDVPAIAVGATVTVNLDVMTPLREKGPVRVVLYEETHAAGPVVVDVKTVADFLNGGTPGPDEQGFKENDFKTVELERVEISGPATVYEGETRSLRVSAFLSDGKRLTAQAPVWSSNPAFPIAGGRLIVGFGTLPSDLTIRVRVEVTEAGKTVHAAKSIRLLDADSRPLSLLSGPHSGFVRAVGDDPPTGFMRLTLNPRGTFTAVLLYDQGRHTVKGTFVQNTSVPFTHTFARPGRESLELTLIPDFTTQPPLLTGEVKRTGAQLPDANIVLYRAHFSTIANPATDLAGRYTLIFLGGSSPLGIGYGAARVNLGGRVRFGGVLGDGSRVSIGGKLVLPGPNDSPAWPIFATTHHRRGTISSLAAFDLHSDTDAINGEVEWDKAPGNDAFFPDGIDTSAALLGFRYKASSGTGKVIDLANGLLTLGSGPGSVALSIKLTEENRIIGPETLTIKLNLKTGLFSGVVQDNSVGLIKFGGALLQPLLSGHGLFKTSNQETDSIQLAPN